MDVDELTPSGSSGLAINANSGTVASGSYVGRRIMMTFPGANGVDHAVVVTGTSVVNGQVRINYWDPTTNSPGYRVDGDYAGLYAVGAVGTAS